MSTCLPNQNRATILIFQEKKLFYDCDSCMTGKQARTCKQG
ncbi:MAG: hypothetical protein [Olavius algarvensis Delta 4 endosymbiont]|nr:MAG: hypothetical protein [Olavius algarvensis Delta 4 endosymbiont]